MPRTRKIEVRPELSAQSRSHPPNPALSLALDAVRKIRGNSSTLGRVADLGCGKLRHYALLAPQVKDLFLIDTPSQLSATHVDHGERFTIYAVASRARAKGRSVHTIPFEQFASATLDLDLIVCVAVLDVVPRATRRKLLTAAGRNLAPNGLCVVIAPRNDSTILQRCTPRNAYLDGHVFAHHGTHTFFCNFRSHQSILQDAGSSGLILVEDISRYRQVCLLLARSSSTEGVLQ